jgi:hypothetical protein
MRYAHRWRHANRVPVTRGILDRDPALLATDSRDDGTPR